MLPRWKYLTVYLSGTLDFPETVERYELLTWASKSITQQINELATQGWEILDMHWQKQQASEELMTVRLVDRTQKRVGACIKSQAHAGR